MRRHRDRGGNDMHDLRTDRLGLLLDQLDRARELAHARLEGLTSPASLPEGAPLDPRRGSGPLGDEEYLWEPAAGAWSIRRRARRPRPDRSAQGSGCSTAPRTIP